MPTTNDWLRQIYNVLSGGSSPGGGGGGATQAEIQAAIEAASNLNDIEPLLTDLQDGTPRTLTLTSPEHGGSGATNFWTVPAGKQWQFICAYAAWIADATAANRSITLTLTSDGSIIFATGSTVYQTASQERYYSFGLVPTYAAFMGAEAQNQRMLLTVPPAFLTPGGRITISYPGLQAGDTISAAIQVLEI